MKPGSKPPNTTYIITNRNKSNPNHLERLHSVVPSAPEPKNRSSRNTSPGNTSPGNTQSAFPGKTHGTSSGNTQRTSPGNTSPGNTQSASPPLSDDFRQRPTLPPSAPFEVQHRSWLSESESLSPAQQQRLLAHQHEQQRLDREAAERQRVLQAEQQQLAEAQERRRLARQRENEWLRQEQARLANAQHGTYAQGPEQPPGSWSSLTDGTAPDGTAGQQQRRRRTDSDSSVNPVDSRTHAEPDAINGDMAHELQDTANRSELKAKSAAHPADTDTTVQTMAFQPPVESPSTARADARCIVDNIHVCQSCGYEIMLKAKTCHNCSASLLVSVTLESPVSDLRRQYHLAREISKLLPDTSFAGIKKSISSPKLPSLTHLLRNDAQAIQQLFEREGIISKIGTDKNIVEKRLNLPSKAIKSAAVVVALIFLAAVYFFFIREDAPVSGRALADKAVSATVMVHCNNQSGTGFFISASQIVTNAHVLCTNYNDLHVITSNNEKLFVNVIDVDKRVDLAMLSTKEKTSHDFLPLADASKVKRGDSVYIIGNPVGMDFSFAKGVISHHNRYFFKNTYIQIDGNVNPGNSGGPVLNEKGEVVGVITLKLMTGDGIALAIPSNYIFDYNFTNVASPTSYNNRSWRERLRETEDLAMKDARMESNMADKIIVHRARYEDGWVYALVVEYSHKFKTREVLTFIVKEDGKEICRIQGGTNGWIRQPEGEGQLNSNLPPARATMYSLRASKCPSAIAHGRATITPEDAVADHPPVTIEMPERRFVR